MRDEVSNLVWGIETVMPPADGSSRRGHEVDTSRHTGATSRWSTKPRAGRPPPVRPPTTPTVRYQLTNRVAENWIPFIPVKITGDNREIQLQRAAMPRLLEGTTGVTPAKIRPRTQLLRPGADAVMPPPYLVYEEEISRAGEIVTRSWQRTRWRNGRVYTWLGAQRQTGRGEASSGLAFDRLVPKA